MLMVIIISENMNKTSVMDTELTFITKVANDMKVNGTKIYNTEKAQRKWQTDLNSKENSKTDRKMVMDNINGQTDQSIKEIGSIICSMEKVNIIGQTRRYTQENGKRTSSMESVDMNGQMANNIKAIS